MKTSKRTHAISTLCLAVLVTSFAQAQSSAAAPAETRTYRVSRTFQVGGEGGWDYLTVVPEHQLLYVPRSTPLVGIDPTTHTLYRPTAEFDPPSQGQSRPRPKPGTFMVAVVSPAGK